MLLQPQQPLKREALAHAFRRCLEHHDTLRLRFVQQESGWSQQYTEPDGETVLTWLDLVHVPETERCTVLEKHAGEIQASLNLSSGPLIRGVYFEFGSSEADRLLIVIHHLVIDGVSWRILLSDLQTAYEQENLPAKTASFQQWAERLVTEAGSEQRGKELAYWRSIERRVPLSLPRDYAGGINTRLSTQMVNRQLSKEETHSLLHEIPRSLQVQIHEVLLTALLEAIGGWTGEYRMLIAMEGHGREDLDGVDVSRTIGWFTTLYPVLLEADRHVSLQQRLKAVSKQLRSVPERGLGYGVSRYLTEDPVIAESLRRSGTPELIFNYLGQFDQSFSAGQMFHLASESQGPSQSLQGMRTHVLEMTSGISHDSLNIGWHYSQNIHDAPTIEKLADTVLDALRRIAAHGNAKTPPHSQTNVTTGHLTRANATT